MNFLCLTHAFLYLSKSFVESASCEVLLNSLNSRGPDEMRMHIPLRAIENSVWHVASNTVGNPNRSGLLWPWTGGSEVCDPRGGRVRT